MTRQFISRKSTKSKRNGNGDGSFGEMRPWVCAILCESFAVMVRVLCRCVCDVFEALLICEAPFDFLFFRGGFCLFLNIVEIVRNSVYIDLTLMVFIEDFF